MPPLAAVVSFLDDLLAVADFPDYPGALNGLQVEIDAEIVKVAAAVDARERTIVAAAESGANLLLVHHGLFWGGVQPLRGPFYRRVRTLISTPLALYSAHLPLDAHAELGNNVLLAQELGLTPTEPFAVFQDRAIGVAGESMVPTTDLIARAATFATRHGGDVRHTPAEAGRTTRRWAICTGAGASRDTLLEAAARDIDTLIVGEGPHWTAIDGEELGLTVIYAGHYATETLGVSALAARVAARFTIPWTFLAAPTGL